MKLITTRLLAAAVAAAALTGTTATAVAADTPPSDVEDFQYPHADQIFKQRGILLKTGNGHITLAACDGTRGLIEVYARHMETVDTVGHGEFCFRVTGKTGYLSLELPSVYGARGNDYNVNVTLKTGTEQKSFPVVKNQWTPVGETADPQAREFTLLEINAQK